jgi:hypothetical protein
MRLYAGVVTLILFWPLAAHADDTERSRRALHGLKSVGVVIDGLRPEVEQSGLTTSAIQTDVEQKLQQAGIPVLDSDESSKAGSAILEISVSVLTSSDGRWSYMITVGLDQDANLARDPSIFTALATTWQVGVLGTIGKQNVRSLRDVVKDLVDKFINAYFAVNPKK